MTISSNFINKVISSKPVEFLISPKAGAGAATIATISSIGKDAVGCYYYVTQTLDNEKIPEEKRKFVAALDLSNGILNVVAQTIVGVIVQNKSKKWFDEHLANRYFSTEPADKILPKVRQPFGNVHTAYQELMGKNLFHKLSDDELGAKLVKQSLNKNELSQIYQNLLADSKLKDTLGEGLSSYDKFVETLKNTKLANSGKDIKGAFKFAATDIQDIVKNAKTIKRFQDIPFKTFMKRFLQNRDFAKTGFTVIMTLVAMQVVVKRMIVPLIATPMASVFKKFMNEDDDHDDDDKVKSSNFVESNIKFQNNKNLNVHVFDKFIKK